MSVLYKIYMYMCLLVAKEGEKDRLVRWSTELRQERETLEHRAGQLNNSLTVREGLCFYYIRSLKIHPAPVNR